jgi:tRNA(Ile)-lysidine synthase
MRQLTDAVARGTDALNIPPSATIVVATSGGPDSTALLHGAAHLVASSARGWHLIVAHLDHQLRDGSALDAERVRQMAESLGLPFRPGRTDVAALARAEGRSTEDAGRQARYRFLEEVAAGEGEDAMIATAHTADDLAETVVLRLVRGSGIRGLRGIPAWRGRVIRPLLGERRAALRAALNAAGIGYDLDPTNDDPAYADRNRVRAEILPAMERLNPRIVDALQRLARLAADDDDVLDAVAAAELATRRTASGIDWRKPPARAIGRRVLRLAAGEPAPSAERIEALLEAAEGPRGGLILELGGGRQASVRERVITFADPED